MGQAKRPHSSTPAGGAGENTALPAVYHDTRLGKWLFASAPGRSSLCAVNKQDVVAVASQSGAWKESTGRTNMPWASTHIVHLGN